MPEVKTATITDSKGRSIEVKTLTRRETLRLMRQWGPASNVDTWVGNGLIAAMARSIDGVPVPVPQTADLVEALADRLDEEGLAAIAEWFSSQRTDIDTKEMQVAAKN